MDEKQRRLTRIRHSRACFRTCDRSVRSAHETLGYYCHLIQNDSTLNLDLGMQIFVKMPNGKIITVEVEPSDTVGDVEAKIQDQQRIIFDGSRLDKKCKPGFYKVQQHSTLQLDLCDSVLSVAACRLPSRHSL